jgi:hypothetical protein
MMKMIKRIDLQGGVLFRRIWRSVLVRLLSYSYSSRVRGERQIELIKSVIKTRSAESVRQKGEEGYALGISCSSSFTREMFVILSISYYEQWTSIRWVNLIWGWKVRESSPWAIYLLILCRGNEGCGWLKMHAELSSSAWPYSHVKACIIQNIQGESIFSDSYVGNLTKSLGCERAPQMH